MDWSLPGLLIAGLAACALGLAGAAVAHGGVVATGAGLLHGPCLGHARGAGVEPVSRGRNHPRNPGGDISFPGSSGFVISGGLGAQMVTRAYGPGRGGGVSAWAERSVPFLFSGGNAVAGASAFLWARACYPGGAMGIDLHRGHSRAAYRSGCRLPLVLGATAFSFLALRLARGRVIKREVVPASA